MSFFVYKNRRQIYGHRIVKNGCLQGLQRFFLVINTNGKHKRHLVAL